MALNDKWVQSLLGYEKTLELPDCYPGSDSGHIGRAYVDGILVIYDIEDIPLWLMKVLDNLDENGNYERAVVNG